jgi:predicted nucleic acid-binding protein
MAYTLIVLDASAALSLVLAEKEGQEVEDLLHDTLTVNGQIFVPGLFWHELGNGLIMAERADRIGTKHTSAAIANFTRLPIVTHPQSDFSAAERILILARENGLNFYDASYLELALRFEAPLKSFDKHLHSLSSSFPLIL